METDSTTFERLALIEPIMRAVRDEGYSHPTPAQSAAIPEILAGRDVMTTAKTGTGKTAAFAMPILQLLHESGPSEGFLRCLILTPTRELAVQIDDSFRAYGRHLKLRTAVVVGGVSQVPQVKALRRRPEILSATPGRLLDLISQGHVSLRDIEFAVLDEADRMLDMGFLPDVRRIVEKLPLHRQTLMFSATLSGEITGMARTMLDNPVRVEITPPATVADNIAQKVMFVQQSDKRALLTDLLDDSTARRVLVFTRTKHRANRVARHLVQAGISADAIHSNKSQGARQRALNQFDRGQVRVLVATDIMARGIDVEDITHVINFEIPNAPEAYVHRIGRTARAGTAGVALSFCNSDELSLLASIEKLTRVSLTEEDHPFHASAIAAQRGSAAPGKSGARPAARAGATGGRGARGDSRIPPSPKSGERGGGATRRPRRRGGPNGKRNADTQPPTRPAAETRSTVEAPPKPRYGRTPRAA